MSIRLLIVDDQELVRTGLRLFLETQDDLEVVGEAGDGAEAIDRARELQPDVIPDGHPHARDGRRRGHSTADRRRDRTAAARARTDDLRPRRVPLRRPPRRRRRLPAQGRAAGRLLEAIRVVHGGEALLSPSITRRLIEDFAARTDPLQPSTALLERLTPRERDVLVLVARGLSNTEIAKRLVVTEATVKTHIGSILMKLDLRGRVQAVVFAYEHGIVVAGEPG